MSILVNTTWAWASPANALSNVRSVQAIAYRSIVGAHSIGPLSKPSLTSPTSQTTHSFSRYLGNIWLRSEHGPPKRHILLADGRRPPRTTLPGSIEHASIPTPQSYLPGYSTNRSKSPVVLKTVTSFPSAFILEAPWRIPEKASIVGSSLKPE